MPIPTRNIDLHLLECFDMLMRERSVSRAAEHMNVSQSSASEMLARLRDRFGDPLLVRTQGGLVPTPRAEQLLPLVRATAEQLRGLLETGEFDPASSRHTFRLTGSDYAQFLLLPALARTVLKDAPHCSFDLLPVNILHAEQALAAGDVDVAIAFYPEPPPSLRRSPLFTDTYCCIARSEHPRLRDARLSAQLLAEIAHVRVAPSGLNYFSSAVDAALESQGLQRRIAFSSPHFLLAAHLVSQSDLLLVLPREAAGALAAFLPITVHEMPLPMRPAEISMYWHERSHHSRAHQWLRERVRTILSARDRGPPVLQAT